MRQKIAPCAKRSWVDHAPALTVIITGIFDEAWLVEIEAIAVA